MNEVNIWDIENKNIITLNTIEQLIEAIKNGKITMNFELKEQFIPGEEITNSFDNSASKKNNIYHYTNEEHPVLVSDFATFINPKFYQKYQNEIKMAFTEYIKNSSNSFYSINENVFSDYILDEILKKDNPYLYLYNVQLTDEQIKKIKNIFINCNLYYKDKTIKISSMYAFSYYTKEQLEKEKNINISLKDLEESDILNLKYLQDNSIITFMTSTEPENNSLSIIKDNILKLNSLNKHFIVKVEVNKRSIFNNIFKDIKLDNIDLVINNDYYDYPYEEYLNEEKKLDNLVKDILDKNLSPFERFLFVYNIVKNYKEYKENYIDSNQSRYLRYILDNEYMVCVGYSRLLTVLLDKVGINAEELSVEVDTSYDKGFTTEEKVINLEGHKRTIVSLDDDKYNIYGLFISDPTWDNNLNKNYFNNALLPFDKMQTDKRMFHYSFYQPVLDIHNFEEYNNQINFLLKRTIKENQKSNTFGNNSFTNILCLSYKELGDKILKTIKCDPKYYELLNNLNNCKEEKDYIDFYTLLGNYLLTRINNPVDEKNIFKAYKDLLIETNRYTNDDDTIQNDFYRRDYLQFPYQIPEDEEYNLEDKKTK